MAPAHGVRPPSRRSVRPEDDLHGNKLRVQRSMVPGAAHSFQLKFSDRDSLGNA
jgi:hypothetical protein